MSYLHPRIAFLTDLLGLRSTNDIDESTLTELLLNRLDQKCERLREYLPNLSRTASEATIAHACAMSKWHLLIRKISTPGCFGQSPAHSWSVADVLPVAMDVGNTDRPLTDGQRVYARHFARRLAKALTLEQPAAHDLAARLYGSESWQTLVGNIPFLSPDEPLYRYQDSESDLIYTGFLCPTAGCSRLTAELAALTQFTDWRAKTLAACHALTRKPDFLSAAHIAVDALIRQRANSEALDCANRTLLVLKERVLPDSPRLDMFNPTNIEYFRLRCARVVALTHLEQFDAAALARDELVSELDSAGAQGKAYVARWLSEYDTERDTWAASDSLPSLLATWKAG